MRVLYEAGLLAVLSIPGSALAQVETRDHERVETRDHERVDSAEAHYDEGVRLFEAEDFAAAGTAFERADALLPARVAMENAIQSHRRGGDLRRAATVATALVERDISARRQAQFVPEVASNSFKVTASCDAPCTITVDGEEERYRTFFFAPSTPHSFVAEFATGVTETLSTGDAGEERTLVLEAPEQSADDLDDADDPDDPDGANTPQEMPRDGFAVIPVYVTLGAAAVTAAMVALTIWSGIDTNNAQAEFTASPSVERFEAGKAIETRTNVLLGVTIGVTVVTAAMAVFTDWSFGGDEGSAGDDSDDNAVRFGVGPLEGGAYASISARIR